MTVAAVVLAAGGGSRFTGATHKLLAPFRGRPVISWVLDEVRSAGFDDVVVVTGSHDLDGLVPEGVRRLANARWSDGQATSLRLAVADAAGAGHAAVVVGLGDQPLVPAAAWRAVGASAGAIVTASFGGQRRPPVKLDRSVWDLLPDAGDEGARVVMRTRPELVSELPCQGNPVDIDTVEDLARWS